MAETLTVETKERASYCCIAFTERLSKILGYRVKLTIVAMSEEGAAGDVIFTDGLDLMEPLKILFDQQRARLAGGSDD